MSQLKPFKAFRPKPELAGQVASVPYDVVNTDEARQLAAGNPHSFLHVGRPEIDLPADTDIHSDAVYAQGVKNLHRLIQSGTLFQEQTPCLYIYQQRMGDHVQAGLVGLCSVKEYEEGAIKRHEYTRKDKEDDRTRHVMTLRSHTGPAFLTYRDSAAIDDMIEKLTAGKPLFDFTAPDGIAHTLWRVDANSSRMLSDLFVNVPYLYIADGHHRSAAAARTAAECAPKNPRHTGKEDYNYFLAVTFPASQLKILPYNRAVKTLNGMTKAQFIQALSAKFNIADTSSPQPSKPGEFCMYLDGKWSLVTPKFDVKTLGVIECLDVSILQDNILAPLLGIDDPRTSKGIDFIGGIRGTAELEKLVNSGKYAVAFSMFPTTLEQLMNIADADAIMPPKSTWFEPKLRDGIVCHNF